MNRPPRQPPAPYADHAALALITVAALIVGHVVAPNYGTLRLLTLGFGYIAVGYVAVSLLIGPALLLRRRRNPVNISLRRDVGIWAAITGGLHVYCVLAFDPRPAPLYFLAPNGAPLLTLFGASNDAGLLATLLLALLALLSSDVWLKRLRGPRWKAIQRFNYLLYALAIAHTLGIQIVEVREQVMQILVAALVLLTVAVQGAGVIVYSRRRRH